MESLNLEDDISLLKKCEVLIIVNPEDVEDEYKNKWKVYEGRKQYDGKLFQKILLFENWDAWSDDAPPEVLLDKKNHFEAVKLDEKSGKIDSFDKINFYKEDNELFVNGSEKWGFSDSFGIKAFEILYSKIEKDLCNFIEHKLRSHESSEFYFFMKDKENESFDLSWIRYDLRINLLLKIVIFICAFSNFCLVGYILRTFDEDIFTKVFISFSVLSPLIYIFYLSIILLRVEKYLEILIKKH